MATDLYAVSYTATKGTDILFSKVASVQDTKTFQELFQESTSINSDSVRPSSVKVSQGPNGPWQAVDQTEHLRILRDLRYRHIVFKCEEIEIEQIATTSSTRNIQDVLMENARRKILPAEKKCRSRPIAIL